MSGQSHSGLGGFSVESHYELEGVLGIKSPVGPENPAVIGFTCPLHPARSQLKAQRWIQLLLVLVHCDVVVAERVILNYEMTWQRKTGYSFSLKSCRL